MNAKTFARLQHAQLRSGLSATAFCRTQGIALSTFHYWRRRATAPKTQGEFVELSLSASAAPATPPEPIRLEFRGAMLTLPEGVSEASLRRLLTVLLERLPC